MVEAIDGAPCRHEDTLSSSERAIPRGDFAASPSPLKGSRKCAQELDRLSKLAEIRYRAQAHFECRGLEQSWRRAINVVRQSRALAAEADAVDVSDFRGDESLRTGAVNGAWVGKKENRSLAVLEQAAKLGDPKSRGCLNADGACMTKQPLDPGKSLNLGLQSG